MFLSVFDLFKIGIGPSSSHTMGPMTAASRFLDEIKSGDWPRPAGAAVDRIAVSLHGSLAYKQVSPGRTLNLRMNHASSSRLEGTPSMPTVDITKLLEANLDLIPSETNAELSARLEAIENELTTHGAARDRLKALLAAG